MSEYQFYEFRTVDKPLSKKAKNEIANWSSRTNPSNTGAVFTYSYGNFPKDEIKVVEKYFDAMFYISNWGTKQLVFKLPNNLIDIRKIRQYCTENGLKLIEKQEFTLLNICIEDEEGGGEWIEGEGWLTSLLSLRNDILAGDFRSLYLIWLKTTIEDVLQEWGDVDLESKEPEVPNNLNSLNGALSDFIDIFEIDKNTIVVASEKTKTDSLSGIEKYSDQIQKLTDDEKNNFLFRLLENEPLLNLKLENKLKTYIEKLDNGSKTQRTIGEITNSLKKLKEAEKYAKAKKKEEKRLAKFKKLENEELDLWKNVIILIDEKKTKSYDEAIKILQDIKELYIYKKQVEKFYKRMEVIKQKYSRLSSLQMKIEYNKLTKS